MQATALQTDGHESQGVAGLSADHDERNRQRYSLEGLYEAPRGGAAPGDAIGKRTLVDGLEAPPEGALLQLKGGSITLPDGLRTGGGDTWQVAAAGVSGPAAELPGRAAIEASMGRPLVARAHTDEKAQAACRELGAEAFTFGSDIAFGSASPSPALVGHEAAHVVQQTSGAKVAGGVGQAGDAFEVEADQVGALVARGESAAGLLAGYSSTTSSASSGAAVQRKVADGGPAAGPNRSAPGEKAPAADPREPLSSAHVLNLIDAARAPLGRVGGFLAAYQAAVDMQAIGPVLEHATLLVANWQEVAAARDAAETFAKTTRQPSASSSTPDEAAELATFEAEWPLFQHECSIMERALIDGIGPDGRLGGRVTGALTMSRVPRDSTAFIMGEAQTVANLLLTVRVVEHLGAQLKTMKPGVTHVDLRPPDKRTGDPIAEGTVDSVKRQAVTELERWRGRPDTYFFVVRAIKARDPELWSQLARQRGESGKTLGQTSDVAQENAREFGASVDVGRFDFDDGELVDLRSRHDGGRVMAKVMSASQEGREALLHKLASRGLLDQLGNSVSWKVIAQLDASIRDPSLRKALEPLWVHASAGDRSPSMRQMERGIPLVGEAIHKVHNFFSGGAVDDQSDSWEAREEGQISPDHQASLSARGALVSLAGVAGGTIAGAGAGAFGGGFFKGFGAGKLSQMVGAGLLGGSVGGVGGVLSSDLMAMTLGLKSGFSGLDQYVKAFVHGGAVGGGLGLGFGAVSIAAGKYVPASMRTGAQALAAEHPEAAGILEKVQQARGAGGSGTITLQMSAFELRALELGQRAGQRASNLLGPTVADPPGGSFGPPGLELATTNGAPAIADELTVTLDARDFFDAPASGTFAGLLILEARKKPRSEAGDAAKAESSAGGVPHWMVEGPKDVPSVRGGAFNRWFNALSSDDLDALWTREDIRKVIEDRLRAPGGLHEWHLVSRTPTFKRWGLTADEIKVLRTEIAETFFKNPAGRHGREGSTTAHNELLGIIDSSLKYDDFVKRLRNWAHYRLEGGAESLPGRLAPGSKQDGD